MSKLADHDPWACLKDVFERLPTLKNRELHTLLPHHWRAPERADVAETARVAAA